MPGLKYYYRVILNYPKHGAFILSVSSSIYKFVYVITNTHVNLTLYGSAGRFIHVKRKKICYCDANSIFPSPNIQTYYACLPCSK